MPQSMGTLRVSVGNFGLSLLALLSNWGCGGATEPEVSNGTAGNSHSSNSGGTGVGGTGTGVGGLGTGTGVGGIGTGGAGVGGAIAVTCTPTTAESAFVYCSEDYTHRTHVSDCASNLPRPTTCGTSVASVGCQSDADCKDRANGYCTVAMPSSSCYCSYGCVRDSDCAAGQICECGDPVGQCVEAKCTSDADCNGGFCASYDVNPGCGGVAFACTSALDACTGGAQCPGGYCVMGASGFRICATAACVIGRPFLVAGEDRRAAIVERRDWSEFNEVSIRAGLPVEQLTRLGQHYSTIAQMEHAAVAAFARLLLELMGHGAPANLIELVVKAQSDETRHAQLAFGLASELLGKPVGPGSLALSDAKLGASLEELAYNTVIEGCVGETIAALEAAECRERALHPTIRVLFEHIAKDETQHAQLSWRVVAWLIEQGGCSVRDVVGQAFADAAAQPDPERRTSVEDEGYGALSIETATELRRQAWRDVIEPCQRRLLDVSPRTTLTQGLGSYANLA